jgi:HKD family nuclease
VEQYINSCVVFHIISDFITHCSAKFMVQELLAEVVDVVCASNDCSMSKEITSSGMVDL